MLVMSMGSIASGNRSKLNNDSATKAVCGVSSFPSTCHNRGNEEISDHSTVTIDRMPAPRAPQRLTLVYTRNVTSDTKKGAHVHENNEHARHSAACRSSFSSSDRRLWTLDVNARSQAYLVKVVFTVPHVSIDICLRRNVRV